MTEAGCSFFWVNLSIGRIPMASQSKQSMPGYQPLSLSTDEPVSFAAPGFAAAGKSLDSSSYVAEPPAIPKSLPPRAAGTPAPMAPASAVLGPLPAPSPLPASTPTIESPGDLTSLQLAERLVHHALRLLELPPELLTPIDAALARSASLVLEHVQDQLKGLLSHAKASTTLRDDWKPAAKKRAAKKRPSRKRHNK
jgi:hypothetical protein